MGHLDVPEVLIIVGVAAWLGLAMYNWAHHHYHHTHYHHTPHLPHR